MYLSIVCMRCAGIWTLNQDARMRAPSRLMFIVHWTDKYVSGCKCVYMQMRLVSDVSASEIIMYYCVTKCDICSYLHRKFHPIWCTHCLRRCYGWLLTAKCNICSRNGQRRSSQIDFVLVETTLTSRRASYKNNDIARAISMPGVVDTHKFDIEKWMSETKEGVKEMHLSRSM